MSIADTAKKLLVKFGEPIEFTYKTGGAYDPTTGGSSGESVVAVSGNGYPSGYRKADISGTAIQSGDVRLVAERVGERPLPDWNCLVDGKVYRVISVQPIRKTGADVIYICQLRK